VQGRLNGQEFSISRSKTASKSGLVFLLGESDLTAQSARETQVLVDEMLGVGHEIFARSMFHGQHGTNELLESTDTKMKDMLSLVVPLSIWQDALAMTRKRAREATKNSDELGGMLSVRQGDVERIRKRLVEALDELVAKENEFKSKEARFVKERGEILEEQSSTSLNDLEKRMTGAAKILSDLEMARQSSEKEHQQQISVLERLLQAEEVSYTDVDSEYHVLLRRRESFLGKIEAAERRIRSLEQSWGFDLSQGVPDDFSLPGACPTCHQPLVGSGEGHSHADLRQSVALEAKTATEELESLRSAREVNEEALSESTSTRRQIQQKITKIRHQISSANESWRRFSDDLDRKMVTARSEQDHASKEFVSSANKLQDKERFTEVDTQLAQERKNLESLQMSVDATSDELKEYETLVADLVSQQNENKRTASVMKDLADAFGQRGVQTFVLQNAVSLLESLTQSYLDDFSDGVQRLELSLGDDDRISRRAFVREADGEFRQRPLASLSGGQWRRCALALNLGFSDLLCRRGKLRPSLCVLDEPLTHLDRMGRSEVGKVLRRLLHHRDGDSDSSSLTSPFAVSTILLILQDLAAEELEEAFDCIDEVVKKDGSSTVKVDYHSS